MGLHAFEGAFAYPYSGVWPLEWPFSVSFALQETGSNTIMTAHEKLTDELQRKIDHSQRPTLLARTNEWQTNLPKSRCNGAKSKIAYADRCHTNDGHLSCHRW